MTLVFGPPKNGWKPLKKKDICYIAGPMTDWPDWNFPWFFDSDDTLTALGFETINPAKRDIQRGFNPQTTEVNERFRREALAWDLAQIAKRATHIAIHPDWRVSSGARAEYYTAKSVKCQIIHMNYDGSVRA